jgi:AcrR family transcriptional regulator
MSQRHDRPPGLGDPPTAQDDPLLDAVRECVLAVGVRRTTATDVARRAGVSRMTLYRRFPDIQSMIAALMTREFTGLVRDAAGAHESLSPARARIAAGAVEGAQRICANPLWQRIIDVDPELLLPYVTQRLGGVQEAGLAIIAAQLRAGQADGSVRDGDPDELARTIELVLRGHVLAARAVDDHTRERTAAELRRMLDGYLAPGPADGSGR